MKKIGIIGAMELEVETLKAHMTTTKITTKAHMEFHEGTLNGTPVVIVRSGVGKVNAALCVQILADLFEVTAIINTGVAGSLNAALDIGDILISRDALHHDVDATIFGYKPGEVPQLGCREFIADEHLAQVAVSTCKEVNPDIEVFEGRIASGDQFVADQGVKDFVVKEFGAYAVEMEGAAIAQAAYLNNVPFLVIRAISDKADGSAEMDYPTFEAMAAEHSFKLTLRILKDIQG